MTSWERLRHGWPTSFPLMQFPNAPLLGALAAWVVAAVSGGALHDYARGAFYVGLAAWAWLEVTEGVNWFRRVLGLAGLVYVTIQIGGLA